METLTKVAQLFLLNPQNQNLAEGKSRLLSMGNDLGRCLIMSVLLPIGFLIGNSSSNGSNIWLGTVICIIISFLLGNKLAEMWRLWQYRRRGQLIKGQVISYEGKDIDVGNDIYKFLFTVHYSFVSPTGGELIGKESIMREDLRTLPFPRPGTPVAVFYFNDKKYNVL